MCVPLHHSKLNFSQKHRLFFSANFAIHRCKTRFHYDSLPNFDEILTNFDEILTNGDEFWRTVTNFDDFFFLNNFDEFCYENSSKVRLKFDEWIRHSSFFSGRTGIRHILGSRIRRNRSRPPRQRGRIRPGSCSTTQGFAVCPTFGTSPTGTRALVFRACPLRP